MKRIKAFAIFCYDFVVGDDWRLAVAVVIGLLITWLAVHASIPAWWVLPVCVAVALAVSLRRARRKARALPTSGSADSSH